MQILYWFQSIRNPVLDRFFSLVTMLGEETVFLVLGILIFWCVNKQKGYFILSVGFLGLLVNQFLKISCRVPRPWVKDPQFTIVESAREAATGYSFPSGHTQISVGAYGSIARAWKNRTLRFFHALDLSVKFALVGTDTTTTRRSQLTSREVNDIGQAGHHLQDFAQ